MGEMVDGCKEVMIGGRERENECSIKLFSSIMHNNEVVFIVSDITDLSDISTT